MNAINEASIKEHIKFLYNEIEILNNWIHDLQSGMYINCVYCGFRYGPEDEVPATMANALKEHIEQCPKHPMSMLKQENEKLKKHKWAKIKNSLKVIDTETGKKLTLLSMEQSGEETIIVVKC